MTVYVINPNSSEAVTRGIAAAVRPGLPEGIRLTCLTMSDGPPGIESDAHVAEASERVVAQANALETPSAVIVACFSDPGVAALRERLPCPVIGIREAAIETALGLGARFGVIAIGTASIPRHLTAFDALGVRDRLAGDSPLGLSVPDLQDPHKTEARMIEVAQRLKDDDGADVLILGCAGMPQYRDAVAEATGLPVVEPCAAAVALALRDARVSPKTALEDPNA